MFRGNLLVVGLVLLFVACGDDGGASTTPDAGPNSNGIEVDVIEPIVVHDNVRYPELDPKYDTVEILADRLRIRYSGVPNTMLEAGHVVVGSHEHGYMRRVVSVGAFEGGVLEVITEGAYLADFIRSGHFRVSIEALSDQWVDGDGVIGGRQSYLGDENKVTFFTPSSKTGLKCGIFSTENVSLDPDVDVTPGYTFDFKLTDGLGLASATIAISGKANFSVEVETTAQLGGQCSVDVVQFLRSEYERVYGDAKAAENLFKYELPKLRFTIPPVPVPFVFTNTVEPVADIDLKLLTTEDRTTGRAEVEVGLELGAKYDAVNGWGPIWEPTRSATASYNQGSQTGETSIEAEFTGGVKLSSFLYDAAGPTFGMGIGLKGSLLTDAALCEYDASVTASLKGTAGVELQIPVIDSTIAEWSHEATLAEAELYATTGTFCGDAGIDATAMDGGIIGPSDTQILYTYGGSPWDMWIVNADGTGARQLARASGGSIDFPSFSPDGTMVAYNNGSTSRVRIINTDGTEPATLSQGETTQDTGAAWLPSGSEILFRRYIADPLANLLVAVDLEGNERMVADHAGNASYMVVSPDGSQVAFLADPSAPDGCMLYVAKTDGSGQTCIGKTGDDPSPGPPVYWGSAGLFVAGSGTAQGEENIGLYAWSTSGSGGARLRDGSGDRFSAVGDTAVSVPGATDGSSDLAIVTPGGATTVIWPDCNCQGTISPSGSEVLVRQANDLFLVNSSGSNRRPLVGTAEREGIFRWGQVWNEI